MKRLIYIAIALLSLAGCKQEAISVELESVEAEGYDGSVVKLTGETQSFIVKLKGNGWKYASPSADTWIVCEKASESEMRVVVSRNTGTTSRTSHVNAYAGEQSIRIDVEQDYWRYFNFYSDNTLINPAAGEYKIPATTNLTDEEMTFSASEDWVSGIRLDDGWLYFTVTENTTGADRPATLSINSELVNESAVITQGIGAQKAIIMSVNTLNFDEYPVYEAYNPANDEVVGLICKEYLYKLGDDGNAIIEGSHIVVYPVFDGKPDYTRGLDVTNGSRIVWNTKVDATTPGNEMIARVEQGSGETSFLAWLPEGATELVTRDPTTEEADAAIIARYNPMILKDSRTGEADSQENTTDYCEYPVLKVGTQFWTKTNFAATRFNNGEPIPTGFTNEEWSKNMSPSMLPMCLISGVGSSTTYIDANNPAGHDARVKYGCLYNYAAIVGQTLEITKSGRIQFEKKDMLAPEGWAVPYKSDYAQLFEYIMQKDIREIGPQDYNTEMVNKMSASKDNTTGFSAIGSRGRASSGLYGGVQYLLTMDYGYSLGSHTVATVRFQSGSYEPLYDLTLLLSLIHI